MFSRVFILISFFLGVESLQGQKDPILFSVKDIEIPVSEFSYIYEKTNGKKATYTEASLKEYLQLYVDFKLQVLKGNEIGLNDKTNLKREQEVYKQQIAKTFLEDRKVVEKLLREAYKRSKEDRKISHIMVKVKETASEKEEREAYKRIEKIRKQINSDNFATLAKQYSEDAYSKTKGGELGYYTVLQLPYDMETAAYTTTKGNISDIVRSKYGYHIIKVEDIRPAYGQVQAAHILIRTKTGATAQNERAKAQIDSIYSLIKSGSETFENLTSKFSQDRETKKRGGIIGWIGINKYSKPFEEALFGLDADKKISAPFQTSSGWHILRRIKAVTNPSYQEAKTELNNKIRKNERFEIVMDALVAQIKNENKFEINAPNKEALIQELKKNQQFLTYRWKPDAATKKDSSVLFTIGSMKATMADFVTTAQRNSALRINKNPRTVPAAVDRIMNEMTKEKCLAFEETQLDTKYPEFKALVREYQEGILLFEVKKELVWDKATNDEEGLQAYFDSNKDKYNWNDRVRLTHYEIKSKDPKVIKKVKAKAKRKTSAELIELFNSDEPLVLATEHSYERGKNPEADDLTWKKGFIGPVTQKDASTSFTKVEEIIPSQGKTLDEARGYVIADYQDQLEKDLIKALRKEYEVKINEPILKSLIKK